MKEYGQDKMPPPEQIYTISHKPGMGNMHLVQKVFEGPFEVRLDPFFADAGKLTDGSLTFFSLRGLRPSL